MQPFTTLTAVAAPFPMPNINTDDIYPGPLASPVVRLKKASMRDRSQMGLNAFAALRYDENAEPNPDFILNRAPYDRAQILVAGANFGCGSSREMAVWALAGIGVRCVIAPSFGDIFFNNCFKNGVLPVRLAVAEVDALLELAANPADPTFTVDLAAMTVTGPDRKARPFDVVEYYRQALLGGHDEITATLTRLDRIDAFERDYRGARPWLSY
jgi:3-isopropylmalate/(R)-2-methylmalate dehydratase small subunit